MANIKSAKKRIKVTANKTLRNKMLKSALNTAVKSFETAIAEKDTEKASTLFNKVVKSLDMAASKGILHKNKAARRKSRLSAKLKAILA